MPLFPVIVLLIFAAINGNNGQGGDKLQNNLDILLNYLNDGSPSGWKENGKYAGGKIELTTHHKRSELDVSRNARS